MGKRALERSSDELELKYPYGNKRLRFSRVVLYTEETVELLNENSITEMPYVYVKPREEFLAKQASKEDNRLNLEDYFDASSMAVALLSTKRFMISRCRKAVREIQFLQYFEKLGWKSDLITDYCQTTHTDINTLMKELKALFFSLKACNVNVDKIIEQFSKDSQNVKLFFEYLTKYLQSLSTRKPVIVLERTEIDPKLNLSQDSLKRKMQEILIPDQNKSESTRKPVIVLERIEDCLERIRIDQRFNLSQDALKRKIQEISDRNKVGKVSIETIDDADYQEIKRANRRKSCTGIREDLKVNKPFVPPYNLQQSINKTLTMDDKRLRKSFDSLREAVIGTDEEELSIHSGISERPVGTDIEDSCDQSCILKPHDKNKQLPSRKLTPQNAQEGSNYDAESSGTIQSTDSLKESEAGIYAGIEENISSCRLRKRGFKRTEDTQQDIPLLMNLETASKPTQSEKQTATTTNDTSSIVEETANELGDSLKNDERMEAGTMEREHLISVDCEENRQLRKRITRTTNDVEKNTTLPLNIKSKSKPTPTRKQITVPTNDASSIEEETANESGDSSKNGERMEIGTKKREPLISNDDVESNWLRKRDTRRTKDIQKNIALLLNVEPKSKLSPTGKQITVPTNDASSIEEETASESGDSSKNGEKREVGTKKREPLTSDDDVGSSQLRKRITRKTKEVEESIILPPNLESSGKTTTIEKQITVPTNDASSIEEETASESGDSSKNGDKREVGTKKREPLISDDDVGSSQLRKRITRKTKEVEESIILPPNLESSGKTTTIEKQITVPTNDASSIEKEDSSESGDSSRNDERVEASTKKREPLICSDTVSTKRDCLSKRSTRSTKVIETDNDKNADTKYKLFMRENISEYTCAINGTVGGIKHPASTIGKDDSTEDCDVSKIKTDTLNLKKRETENSFIPTENDRSVYKLGDSLKHTEVRKETLHIENISLINSKEFSKINADNENKDDTERNKDMDSGSSGLADQLKSGKENKHFVNKSQAPKDAENEMGQNVDIENDKNTNVLRGSVESVLAETIDTDNSCFKTNETVGGSTDVDGVRISQNEKSDTIIKRNEINKIVEGVKQMELSNNEIPNTSQYDAESKSSKATDVDLQGEMISFENSEEFIENACYSFNHPPSFQNSSKGSDTGIKRFEIKPDSVTYKDDRIIIDSSSKNIETKKRSTVVIKRSFDIESLISLDDPKSSTDTFTEEKQFEKNNESVDSPRNDESMEVGTEKRGPLISSDSEESSRLRNRDTIKKNEVEKNITLPPNLASKGEPTPTEKQVTIPTNDTVSTGEQKATASGGSPRNDERMDVFTEKREPLISSDSVESSPLRKRGTRKKNEVEKNITLPPNLASDGEPTPTEKQVTIPTNDTTSIEEEMANESGDSPRSDQRMEAGTEKREPWMSSDSVESSPLRKRVTRKTKEIDKSIILPPNLESKGKPTTTEKQVTIPTNDTTSIEEETANESGDSPRSDQRMEVGTEKREPWISSDSSENCRLRNRVIRKKKEEKNSTLPQNLESKGEPTTAEKQVTVPTNDTISIEANRSGDSLRNDERMEDFTEKRELLISSVSVESSRLRKRVTRKTKEIDKSIILPPNLESKGKPTTTEKQVTIPTNDTTSIEEEKANESGDSPRSDQRMEVGTEKREPSISSDSSENSRLRNRVIRKKKEEKNSTLPQNLESKGEPTTAEKQVTIPTNDTISIEANRSGDSLRNDERMEDFTEKRELLISSVSAESSRLRKRVTRKTKEIDKSIILPPNLESSGKTTTTIKQLTVRINNISSVTDETASVLGDSPRNDKRMEVGTEKREPLLSSDNVESSRLRKIITRKTKGKTTTSEKQLTVPTNDTVSNGEEKANASEDSPRNDERMDVFTEKREPLISSDSVESSPLRKRGTRKKNEVEENIMLPPNLASKGEPTPTEKQVTIPTNDTTSIEEETANESGDSPRSDQRMEVGTEKREPSISSDSSENSRLRNRVIRKKKEEKNSTLPQNLESKGEPTTAETQVTIPTNDTISIEANRSGDSLRNDERMEDFTEKRELLISSVSVESSRLRKRVTRKTKEIDKSIILPPNLESSGKTTTTIKQLTVRINNISSVTDETAIVLGDSPRNDKRMEVGTEKREPLLSSDNVESSRLRKIITRKTKGKTTTSEKQLTVPTNDTVSNGEEKVNASEDSPRNDERMDVFTEKREPLISSDSVESSPLRKRGTRKKNEEEKNITLPPNLASKGEPTPTEKQVTIPTNDTTSIEEETANESGDSPRSDQRMEFVTEKREPWISSDSVESSPLRKRVTRKTKEIDKSIILPPNLESKGKPTTTEKQVTIPTNDTTSIEEETANESGDSPRSDQRMEVGTEKREPWISSDSSENSRLRNRVIRKKKEEKNSTLPQNLESKGEPTTAEKQVTVPTNDTISIEANRSGDSLGNDERMEDFTEKRELLISSVSVESSRLRKRVTRKTKEIDKSIILPPNLESKGKPTTTEKQVTIPTNNTTSIEEETANESGDSPRSDQRMEVGTEKREPSISSDKVYTKRGYLRKRSTRSTKVVESEDDNGTALSLNFDTTRKQPVGEKISESTPDIGDTVGDDISEGTKTDESSVDESTNLSSETKEETNDSLKKKVVVDVGVSRGSTETKIKSIKHGGRELVSDILIKNGTTVKINERRKNSENQRRPIRPDEQLVVRVERNQGQSATEVNENKTSKRSRNNVKSTRNYGNGAVGDLRKYGEEGMKADESERLTRNQNKVNTESDGCDLSIRIGVYDVAEDLRRQAEENAEQSRGSSDNEISQIWCFQTKDTEKRSFEDVDSKMLTADCQMPSILCRRLESMDIHKDPTEEITPCPDFKANGNSISCLYDTLQEVDFSWQCYKFRASTSESSRSIGSNQFLSENGDVPQQMLKIDVDIENQIFTGDDLCLLEGFNTGLPSLFPIQSTSAVMSPRKLS